MKRKLELESEFKDRVLRITAEIPSGSVLTYKAIAVKASRPKAARAVGNILKNNFNPAIPCHRVIRSDGQVGDYNRGGRPAKIKLLRREKAI